MSETRLVLTNFPQELKDALFKKAQKLNLSPRDLAIPLLEAYVNGQIKQQYVAVNPLKTTDNG